MTDFFFLSHIPSFWELSPEIQISIGVVPSKNSVSGPSTEDDQRENPIPECNGCSRGVHDLRRTLFQRQGCTVG